MIFRVFTVTVIITFIASCTETTINITDKLSHFTSECNHDIFNSEEETLKEDGDDFILIRSENSLKHSELSFQIITNCGRINQGIQHIRSDTLIFEETDVRIVKEVLNATDSLGNVIEIVEETRLAEHLFCNCLMTYKYTFDYNLSKIRFLRFHDYTLALKP